MLIKNDLKLKFQEKNKKYCEIWTLHHLFTTVLEFVLKEDQLIPKKQLTDATGMTWAT